MSRPKHPIKALTLWPEWAWAVTHLGKDVENRMWKHPPYKLVGDWLAIHAGRLVGGGTMPPEQALALVWETAPEEVRALCARPELAKVQTSAVVALARIGQVGADLPSPWSARGQWQLGFSEVLILPAPVVCAGVQGIWYLPDFVARRVLEQLPKARREVCRFGVAVQEGR